MATISKKLGQFRQWTGERLGTAEKTDVSEEFRRLDLETESRKDGVENMTVALTDYAKTLSKRSSKDKNTSVVAMLAKTLVQQGKFHGEKSMYGLALQKIGVAEAQIQELQAVFADSLRKGLLFECMSLFTSMKDYASLKKKLENRRLDYDAKMNRLQKSKKEKPGLEEEMKTSQTKYNETLLDVETIMSTFADREELLLEALIQFANAQHEYFRRGLEELDELKSFLTESKLQEKILENAANPDKTAILRRNSKLMSVLPGSVDSMSARSISRDSLGEERAALMAPQAIANVSRSASIRSAAESVDQTGGGKAAPMAEHAKGAPAVECVVEAMYSFEAENESELSIRKGDVIRVTRKIDEGWWHGECDGRAPGIFPANYVRTIDSVPATPRASSTSTSTSTKRNPPEPPKSKSSESVSHRVAAPAASSNNNPSAKISTTSAGSAPRTRSTSAVDPSACGSCGCEEYSANVFKPGQCNNCFHRH